MPAYPTPFDPYWQTDEGQAVARARYAVHQSDLLTPLEAALIIYPDQETPNKERLIALKYHVQKGHVEAIPKPPEAEHRSAKIKRRQRGSTKRLRWGIVRAEAERFAQAIQQARASGKYLPK